MIMDNQALYQERYDRIKKTINLEPVDRVPLIFMGTAFSARHVGITMAEYCKKPNASFISNYQTMVDYGFDGVNLAGGGRITPILTSLWLSRLGVPGRDLPEDSLWQVMESEVMTHEDYDYILANGWKKFVNKYMPRVISMWEFIPAMMWYVSNQPRIRKAHIKGGYVIINDSDARMPTIPFEYLCGGRSMTQFFFDLYRMPDKIQEVMDVILEDILADIRKLKPAKDRINGTWVGGWRSASSLVSPKLWDRFVWPYFVQIVDALIEKGITPVLHLDQDWSRDIERLRELPAKKCILNPDGMTDMVKFKKLVGDQMAMMGDIPASMLVAGTPEDIDKYVKELIEIFEGQGLLLCPGCDAPINTKPENMQAFVDAGHKYGVM